MPKKGAVKMDLLAWYNLIFVAPIGLAGVYLILSASGIGGDHEASGGADHDVDVGADHDVELAMDHDVDVDMDHDVEVAMDHDVVADVDHEVSVDHPVDVHHGGVEHEVHDHHVSAASNSLALRALSVLGLGKVPVSILLTTLMVLFGAIGLVCNGLFSTVLPWDWAPNVYVWPSLAAATILSLTLTGSIAQFVNRIMPTNETYAMRNDELVGRIGELVYAVSEGQRGIADVKDEGGTWHRISVQPVDGAMLKGADIIIVRYHREGDYYDVSRSPL